MEKPKIAFDVDGVLGDFLYQYSRYHKKIYPDSGIDFRMITDYKWKFIEDCIQRGVRTRCQDFLGEGDSVSPFTMG